MKLNSRSILGVVSFLCLATTLAQNISWSIPGCQDMCGNVTIPYPFGIGPRCSANSSFSITCNTTTTPAKPFLSSINRQVLNISMLGVVIVNQPVAPMGCSDEQTTGSLPISLRESPFTFSAQYNTLAVLGCTNFVELLANETTAVGGCKAICQANAFIDYSCSGLNCCNGTIPQGLKDFRYRYRSFQNYSSNFCGYAFPVYTKWFQQDYRRYSGLHFNKSYPYDEEFVFAPLVLEWELDIISLPNPLRSCKFAGGRSYYHGDEYVSWTKYCSCEDGFQGNPYVPKGCVDIDECAFNQTGKLPLCLAGTCLNKIGSYRCRQSGDSYLIITLIIVGSVLGPLFLLVAAWKSARAIRKIIKAKRRREFFKRRLLLQQQLSSTDNSLEKAKLFSYKELAQSTDHYNENRILGRGGQGTVYKGMLKDGKIVAVKKSKKLEEGDLEAFINEVVILSQLNHRNVVKLLGCCLETEVPLLVYEFVPNGTLFQHIHEPSEELPLTWEMRVRIAREVASALAYLHSAASVPIYHRDIKSANILLDEKYRAKVSDFGTSRSVAIDQTHLTTRVLGTFGYLDPEYFQSSQFTEKSDVYSFGVVMVELLTGEKAVSSLRVEEGRGLATYFLQSMEKDQLFDILDARVLNEGKREEILVIVELASRCLHLNGRRMPTMKEVAAELEEIKMMKADSSSVQYQDDKVEWNAADIEYYDDFSSISGSMHFDTITPTLPTSHPLLAHP